MTTTTQGPGDPVTIAAEYLPSAGLRVLDSKWQYDAQELAIVAAGLQVLVVFEVQSLTRKSYRLSADAMPEARIRRLRKLAVAWMDAHGMRAGQLRVDRITVIWEGPGGHTIEHIQGVG
jgi:putative endonuclease